MALFCLGWLGILIFNKRSSFQVPLCEPHQAEWKKWNLYAGLSWLPGVVLSILGGIIGGDAGAVILLLGFVLFLGGLVTALIIRSRKIVMPTKIDKTHSWLRGIHANVLQAVATGRSPYGG
jgi:uncharacterized membrane protein